MKNKGITLIALIITIIILLILAGVTISALADNGLFGKAKISKMRSDYTSAKEIIDIKLMEVQADCIGDGREYTIVEIAKSIKEDKEITIEKYYNENTSLIKTGITENLVSLKGIVVSVNRYSEYKFLIGKSCEIEGITIEEITDTFEPEDFPEPEVFEEDILGNGPSNDNENDDNNDTPETTISTIEQLAKNGKIKVGDYINYSVGDGYQTDENGNYIVSSDLTGTSTNQTYNVKKYNKAWRVLHVDEETGKVEIFSEENILINDTNNTLKLSGKSGYNNLVSILNTMSRYYINSDYASSARSIGSNPSEPDEEVNYYEDTDLLEEDQNYTYDLEAVKAVMTEEELNTKTGGGNVLLASRMLAPSSSDIQFRLRSYYYKTNTTNNEGYAYSTIYTVEADGTITERELKWCYVVPVITLKNELKIEVPNENIEHDTEETKWMIKE